jgi:two-component system, chemotaxis family, protein-glutamate methylesterase/glutaminase
MPDHGIVVVGASAGGVEALAHLAASLPADLSAAVFVVLHLPATGASALPEILGRHGPLPAAHVTDGEPIQPGRIYVAPPDHHVLLRAGHVHLSRGPR